jgi:hypothetical protein
VFRLLGGFVGSPFFKTSIWPTQGSYRSGPAHASDVIILDIPHGDLNECSS